MTRSARLLAAAIARASSSSSSSSRTAAAAAAAPLSTPTAAASTLLAAAASPLLLSPHQPFAISRRDPPAPPTTLDWARSYAKGARGGGGGGKKGGGGGGGGGGKKGKRGRAAASDDEDDEDDEAAGGDADAGDDEDEDPVKLDEIEGMMKAAIEHYSHELAGVRTGRANPGLLENLLVQTESPPSSSGGGSGSHGHHQPQQHGHAHVPLRALGTVTVRDPQTLTVSVYDPAMAGAVARAIQNSPLGLSAVPGGGDVAGGGGGGKKQQSSEVLVRLPRMTREVVERMVKLVHAEGEGALVSIRRARQKALDAAKRAYGGGGGGGGKGGIKSTDLQRAEKEIAALLEKYTAEVERMKRLKDKELREHRD